MKESAGYLEVTLRRTETASAGVCHVSTVDGTAQGGMDFAQLTKHRVKFEAGEATAVVPVKCLLSAL